MRAVITTIVEIGGDLSDDTVFEQLADALEGETRYFLEEGIHHTPGFEILPKDVRVEEVETIVVEF